MTSLLETKFFDGSFIRSDNQETLGELLLGFFRYYAEQFRYAENVMIYLNIKVGYLSSFTTRGNRN